jgi:hypothetical protein
MAVSGEVSLLTGRWSTWYLEYEFPSERSIEKYDNLAPWLTHKRATKIDLCNSI